ncbi:MAG TPA: alpha/beta hydrolase-fold protein [Polyangiaceae bacterium]|nr:alpha/beta hydrolase-fold protein [Polyangiaceae bacterium]
MQMTASGGSTSHSGGGGSTATGGTTSHNGGTGGSAMGNGGSTANGGATANGGSTATGGTPANGGSPANGGMGGASGGADQGGTGGQAMGGAIGVQADPGTTGDGMATQDAPYNAPAESTGLLNGAMAGEVTGPLIYPSPAIYPGAKFTYYTYVPAQYQAGKPAALMVFLDAELYIDRSDTHFHGPTVFDNLIAEGSMPPTIALFVGTGTPDGSFDFNSQRLIREAQYSKFNDTFSRFLLEEIIPDLITSKYDVVTDPDGWAIGGQSSGGNCALIVGVHASDSFHKILTDNGAFDNADPMAPDVHPGTSFPGAIADGPVLPLRVSLLSGPNDIPETHQYNQDVVAALEAKGYHYRYIEGSGGHYPPDHAVSDFPDELRWLWRNYTLPWYP